MNEVKGELSVITIEPRIYDYGDDGKGCNYTWYTCQCSDEGLETHWKYCPLCGAYINWENTNNK
jgi:hypothetical protein